MKGCVTLVVIVFVAVILLVTTSVLEVGRNHRINKLEATLLIEPTNDWLHPLVVTIQNNSEESVISSTWKIAAYHNNHSSHLLRSNIYVSDFIIPAGAQRRFHCDVPDAKPDVEAVNQPISDYRWKVELIDAQYSGDDTLTTVDDELVKIRNSGKRPLVRSGALNGAGTGEEPMLLGMKSIGLGIESASWVKKKGQGFLTRLLTDDSGEIKDKTRDFRIQLGLTNASPVPLNITEALKLELHGGSRDRYISTMDLPEGKEVILKPNESSSIGLIYTVDTWNFSDEDAWSLRLADGDHFIIVLNGPSEN